MEQEHITKQHPQHFTRGVVCTLAGAVLWGFSGSCAQLLLSNYGLSAPYITGVRMVGAGLLFLAVLLILKRKMLLAMLRDKKTVIGLVVFGIFGLYASQITYVSTIGYTNAGTATVLQCLGIVFVMAYTCLRRRKRPTLREGAGLVLALASVVIIATQGDLSSISIPLPGLLWGIATGIAVAICAAYPKKLLAQWGSFAVTGVGMLLGGVVAFAIARPWTVSVSLDVTGTAVFAISVLVGTFAAFFLYLQGVADIGPMKASLLSVAEPVSATLISWLWLGTQFPPIDFLGFALMIAMVFLVTSEKPESEELEVVEVPPRTARPRDREAGSPQGAPPASRAAEGGARTAASDREQGVLRTAEGASQTPDIGEGHYAEQ